MGSHDCTSCTTVVLNGSSFSFVAVCTDVFATLVSCAKCLRFPRSIFKASIDFIHSSVNTRHFNWFFCPITTLSDLIYWQFCRVPLCGAEVYAKIFPLGFSHNHFQMYHTWTLISLWISCTVMWYRKKTTEWCLVSQVKYSSRDWSVMGFGKYKWASP